MIATKDEVQEAVNTKLWIKHSFLAAMSARVGTEFVEEDIEQIGWTDGKTISVNWKYISESEKEDFIAWEEDFEYNLLGLPKPNLIFFIERICLHFHFLIGYIICSNHIIF